MLVAIVWKRLQNCKHFRGWLASLVGLVRLRDELDELLLERELIAI